MHYNEPISVQITATAISRVHVYFENKYSGPCFYPGSWPDALLNFSIEYEHFLKQKIITS